MNNRGLRPSPRLSRGAKIVYLLFRLPCQELFFIPRNFFSLKNLLKEFQPVLTRPKLSLGARRRYALFSHNRQALFCISGKKNFYPALRALFSPFYRLHCRLYFLCRFTLQMLPGFFRDHTATWCTLEKAALNEIGLIDVLNSSDIF